LVGPEQDVHYHSSPQTVDLYEEIDEIQRELHHLQLNNRMDNFNYDKILKKIRELRSHFAYIEYVAILTGDTARLEPKFHCIEMKIRDCETETRR
jgi:hypothetical protein